MPSLFNREVQNYKVSVFESSNLSYDRSILLTLSDPDHTVSIQFPSSAPEDFVDIGTGFSTVMVDRHKFDEFYKLLQTESPLFFTAYEFGTLRFVGLTTDPEATGEGFRDADTSAA